MRTIKTGYQTTHTLFLFSEGSFAHSDRYQIIKINFQRGVFLEIRTKETNVHLLFSPLQILKQNEKKLRKHKSLTRAPNHQQACHKSSI